MSEYISSINELTPQPDGTVVQALPGGAFLLNPTENEERVRLAYVAELQGAIEDYQFELEKKQKELDEQKKENEELSKDLCDMEDWLLGTRGTWGACDGGKKLKERIRDLIAAEGELGDLKEKLKNV